MNKDRVEGKVKDVTGRLERQAGEWTGDTEAQVRGGMKQAEGKIQNAWGQAKDAANKAAEDTKTRQKTSRPSGETADSAGDKDVRSGRKAS
jgi:uncharacterized protein YjbJ (UPF0337 family)